VVLPWNAHQRVAAIEALARLVEIVAYVLTAAIFLRAVLFWVGLDSSNRVVAFLHDITKVRHGGELGEPSRGAPAW
jgi:hypothetical protein